MICHASEEIVFLDASILTPTSQFSHLVIHEATRPKRSVPVPNLLSPLYFNGP